MKKGVETYLEQVAKERLEWQTLREDFAVKRNASIAFSSKMVNEIVKKYSKDEQQISYKDLMFFKVGERIEFNDKVDVEKVYEDESSMTFLTYTQDGGYLSLHSHDCLEIVNVIKGDLIEKTRGYKAYPEGSQIAYALNEKHEPYATRNSVWEVKFIKNVI